MSDDLRPGEKEVECERCGKKQGAIKAKFLPFIGIRLCNNCFNEFAMSENNKNRTKNQEKEQV